MNKNNEQQINDILNSMKGSKRAKPQRDLFAQIQAKIQAPKVKILSMYQLRAAAAVGLLIVTLNVYAFGNYFLNTTNDTELVMQDNSESLISNYQLYE